jgi:uncharacterized protein YheU (UPF0270 family)
MEVDDDLIRRLVYLKRILLESDAHLRSGTDYHRVISVILLDAINENIMRLVLAKKFGEYPANKIDFPDLVKLVVRNFETSGNRINSNTADIEKLRAIRNNAQHRGIIPDVYELQAGANATQALFEELVSKLGLDYGELKLALLIKNENVKKMLVEAERLFEKGDYKGSAGKCALAFHEAKELELQKVSFGDFGRYHTFDRLNYHIPGHTLGHTFSYGSVILREGVWQHSIFGLPEIDKTEYTPSDPALGKVLAQIKDKFNQLLSTLSSDLEELKLPLDHRGQQKFRIIAPMVQVSFDKDGNKIKELKYFDRGYNKEDNLFCLNFVTDTILSWEALEM